MKKVILTQFTAEFEECYKLCRPTHEYLIERGWEIHSSKVEDTKDLDCPIGYMKAPAILAEFLDGADVVLWLDADVVIYCPEALDEAIMSATCREGFLYASDENGLNSGVLAFFPGPDTNTVLDAVWNARYDHPPHKFHEQTVLQLMAEDFGQEVPHGLFNSTPNVFDPGDAVLHLAGTTPTPGGDGEEKARVARIATATDSLETITNREIDKWKKDSRVLNSPGDFGDIVYALEPINRHFYETGQQTTLILFPHWYEGSHGMDPARVDSIRPLLAMQPSIKRVAYSPLPHRDILALDGFALKNHLRRSPFRNLQTQAAATLGLDPADINTPWLHTESVDHRYVAISRTARYHNVFFPWAEIMEYMRLKGIQFRFLGLESDYLDFYKEFPEAGPIWGRTFDMWDLANFIGGAPFFIGNHGPALAIAESKKLPMLVESDPGGTSCRTPRLHRMEVPGLVSDWRNFLDEELTPGRNMVSFR
jgi:hypothetical protein